MTTISINIPERLNQSLDEVAKNFHQTKDSLIKRAIKEYLQNITDYQVAEEGYKRYLASGKKGVSIEELARSAVY